MATTEVSPPGSSQDEELFRKLDDYPWDADAEFQGGLRAILGPNPDPERAEQKYNVPIDFTPYRTWHTHHSSRSLANGAVTSRSSIATEPPFESSLPEIPPVDPNSNTTSVLTNPLSAFPNDTTSSTASPPAPPAAPYPPTFSQIVELITTGQAIPNIKEIPDTLLEGQESQATAAKRKKPWEKD
ncbi:MAG: hypothetical protein LQ347_004425 [Umbilicaria vellea]|nr:MAG: hypothetical protein LQ347_004425 [Umbilicaria vellea]